MPSWSLSQISFVTASFSKLPSPLNYKYLLFSDYRWMRKCKTVSQKVKVNDCMAPFVLARLHIDRSTIILCGEAKCEQSKSFFFSKISCVSWPCYIFSENNGNAGECRCDEKLVWVKKRRDLKWAKFCIICHLWCSTIKTTFVEWVHCWAARWTRLYGKCDIWCHRWGNHDK